jgi:hypothetical protein
MQAPCARWSIGRALWTTPAAGLVMALRGAALALRADVNRRFASVLVL